MIEAKKNLKKGLPTYLLELEDRRGEDASRDLTPAKVDRIMAQANSGDSREQCRLARELLEKSDRVAHALETRKNAVLGCAWKIVPGEPGKAGEEAAARLQAQLEECGDGDLREGFHDLLEDMMYSLLSGFLVSEILWVDGGDIAGFQSLPGEAMHFMDGFLPRLVTREQPLGVELPRERFIFHRWRRGGHDPARGGLIRPLAWLHCFRSIGVKDALSFIERYGMPFAVAKVDDAAWAADWRVMQRLIKSFGPSGGGVVTKNVELELLESRSDGEVYFRLLEYLDQAIEKVLLGQLASSGESAGLSKGDAQSQVRQDILESDCRALMRSIDLQVCKSWSRYNLGESARAPRLLIEYEAPEDRLTLAQTLQTLSAAGLEADEEEMSRRFGMKLVRRAAPAAQGWPFGAEATVQEPRLKPGGGAALRGWLSPAAALLEKLADESLSDEELDRELRRLRAAGRAEVFGDSGGFEAELGAHIAGHIAAGAAGAWRQTKGGGHG